MSDPKPDPKDEPKPAQVRRDQKVTYHGEKDHLMVARRFNGVGYAWLTLKDGPWKEFKDDLDGFWAREGDGPGEWEPIPPRRKKPKG